MGDGDGTNRRKGTDGDCTKDVLALRQGESASLMPGMPSPLPRTAIVRDIPDSFPQCVTTFQGSSPIDVTLARLQHRAYCATLEGLGLELVRLVADEGLPDCCFVEDTTLVVEEMAILTELGTPSRKQETHAIAEALLPLRPLQRIQPPATLEGGDVMRIGKVLYIGVSRRTSRAGIAQVGSLLGPHGYTIIPVEVWGTLHLKSVCTYVGRNCVVMAEGHFDTGVLAGFTQVVVPPAEAYAANCLAVGDQVLLPAGYPETAALLAALGFSVISLDMSEFEKADGALTCMSVLV